jgi:hypothetical protein
MESRDSDECGPTSYVALMPDPARCYGPAEQDTEECELKRYGFAE